MKISTLFFLLLVCAVTAQAQLTFTVTRSDDRNNATCVVGDCSLREAVKSATAVSSNDTINFTPSVTNITLTNEIVINNAGTLTINGNGANVLTIDGGAGTNRIFATLFVTVTISGVTLTGGNGTSSFDTGKGGAIFAQNSTLVLNSVHVTANSSTSGGGGVFFNSGVNHQILNSTFSANTAGVCGGFVNDNGTLAVSNSTISGNSVRNTGGGFCNSGNTTLRNVTVTANSATIGGGGILIALGNLNLGNTIVAGNIGNPRDFDILAPQVTSAGNNLIGDNTFVEATFPAGNPNSNNDFVGTSTAPINPVLGPLQNNGGTTPTHALLFGSPAIDAGNNCVFLASCPSGVPSFALLTDQRGAGFTRSADGNGDTIQVVDIGAFEAQTAQVGPTAAAVGVGGRVMTASGRGIQNVVITMIDFEGNIRVARSTSFGYYRFDDVMAGETYILSVKGKRFSFIEQTQVRSINEETNNIDFIGYSEKGFK